MYMSRPPEATIHLGTKNKYQTAVSRVPLVFNFPVHTGDGFFFFPCILANNSKSTESEGASCGGIA